MSSGEAEARHVAAATAKARGSEAYAAGNYASAVRCFGEAISVAAKDDPDVHVYHSNRCAARLQVGDVEGATKDAEATTRLAPKWAKGWSRLGNCLSRDPTRVSDARRALEKAVRLGSVDARDALADLNRRHPASAARARGPGWRERLRGLGARVRNLRPTGASWRDALVSARAAYDALSDTQQWIVKAILCLVAFLVGRAAFGGPDLPFGLGGGRPRRTRAGAYAAHDAYDDDAYVSNGTLGGLGTLASLAVLYFAYKNGASPYTLMMIANALGLGGGRRRGMGYGYGGFPGMGYGGMGRRGFGRGFF